MKYIKVTKRREEKIDLYMSRRIASHPFQKCSMRYCFLSLFIYKFFICRAKQRRLRGIVCNIFSYIINLPLIIKDIFFLVTDSISPILYAEEGA